MTALRPLGLFLAIDHRRLGQAAEAHACLDRTVRWWESQKNLSTLYAQELSLFRSEAEAVLAGPVPEVPADVFAPQ
jgi:hypothetical protein